MGSLDKTPKLNRLSALVTTCCVALWSTGCPTSQGKTSQDKAALNQAFEVIQSAPNPDSSAGPSSTGCPSSAACYDESYRQPAAQISRSVDILLMVDTSESMLDNRVKVAQGLQGFIGELPAEVDFRIAVILAQGPGQAWGGKIFTYKGYSVWDSTKQSIATIQDELKTMMINTPKDTSGYQSELGSWSLMKALTDNLAANRAAGFFRPNAALAVIFISDENDICAPYVNQPSMPGLTSIEKGLRKKACPNGIPTANVVSLVQIVQAERPWIFADIIHTQENYFDPKNPSDGFGWGYHEIVQSTGGVEIDIVSGDYTAGLSSVGRLTNTKLNLILDYTLQHSNVDPSTIHVTVDGSPTDFVYDAALNQIHLSEGGQALSWVEISYCQEPGPNPSPSPSPSPNPSPSASPSPPPCTGLSCGVLGG